MELAKIDELIELRRQRVENKPEVAQHAFVPPSSLNAGTYVEVNTGGKKSLFFRGGGVQCTDRLLIVTLPNGDKWICPLMRVHYVFCGKEREQIKEIASQPPPRAPGA